MIHFLRNKSNKTVAECEVWINSNVEDDNFIELSSSIDIFVYSLVLLSISSDTKKINFACDVDAITEMRGYMWEVVLCDGNNGSDKEKEEIEEMVSMYFKELADTYNLHYITD